MRQDAACLAKIKQKIERDYSISSVQDHPITGNQLMSRHLTLTPAILSLAVSLGGCAGADFRPVVDMRGHTEVAYQQDLAACPRRARGVRNNTDIAEDAGIGALGGAAGGAVFGAIGGAPGLGAGVGALTGIVGGGGYKEVETERREERVVKNCMSAHGYRILG
jgi:hypothetical protein